MLYYLSYDYSYVYIVNYIRVIRERLLLCIYHQSHPCYTTTNTDMYISSITTRIHIQLCYNYLYTCMNTNLSISQCNSMLIYLNRITVMYISSITSMLYANVIDYPRRSQASHELRRSESKKAKLKKLSSNISDRIEA